MPIDRDIVRRQDLYTGETALMSGDRTEGPVPRGYSAESRGGSYPLMRCRNIGYRPFGPVPIKLRFGTVHPKRQPRGTAKDPAPLGADFVRLDSERELRPQASQEERLEGVGK